MGMSTDGFAITPFLNSWAYQQTAYTKSFCFTAHFKDRQVEVRADSQLEALELAASYFRTHNRKQITLTLMPFTPYRAPNP